MVFRNFMLFALFAAALVAVASYLWGHPDAGVQVREYLLEHAEAVVTFFLLFLALLQFVQASRWTQFIRRRENYMRLEFESVALFRFLSEHPEVVEYLEQDREEDSRLETASFWLASQAVNLFEIIISLHRDKLVTTPILATWVAWFYELGTAVGFRRHWDELSFHYLGDVSTILDKAIGQPPLRQMLETREFKPLIEFYDHTATVIGGQEIRDHLDSLLDKCRQRPPLARRSVSDRMGVADPRSQEKETSS